MKLLIVDDNEQILGVLKRYAEREGYETVLARTGTQALELFRAHHIDLVLLDVMMPEMDGYAVCREIRKTSLVPVIMVTARGEDYERIMGLDIGADDYIVKPFSPGEVMARVRAVLRRIEPHAAVPESGSVLRYDNLCIDLDRYEVTVNGQPIAMTRRAVEILWTLAAKPERTYTREMLLSQLWGDDYYGDIRAVDSQIKRMRLALGTQPHPNWDVKTIWGVGYRFEKKA